MRIVYVKWIDAVSDAGWAPADKVDDVHECETIGYLIKETELGLVIASTISQKESNARITIPKAWIKRKKYVKI